MAYKFQLGAAKLSGSTQFNDRVDVIGDIDLSASSIDSVEIAELNAFDTGDLSEGSNLYYTDARSRASVSAVDAGGDGSFAYNSSTGVFTYTGPSAAEARAHLSADGDLVSYNSTTGLISTNASAFTGSWDVKMAAADTDALSEGSSNLYFTQGRARAAISVTDAGGDGSLAYNSSTGVITYTGPSAAEVRAHVSVADSNSIDMSYNSTTGVVSADAKVDASSIEIDASNGLQVKALGVTNAMLAGSITNAKLVNSTISGIALGSNLGSLTVAAGSALAMSSYNGSAAVADLAVQVDGSSIEVSSNALRVKAGGITNAMLGGSIASTKLAELNNFTTDDLAEGSSNLYYTDARARAAVSAVDAGGDGSFAYNSSTGVFTYTGPSAAEARAHLSADGDLVSYNSSTGLISTNATNFTGSWDVKMAAADTGDLSEGSNLYYTDARARAAISVVDSGGDGSLSYAAGTGVITYTGPSAAEARAHFSGGTGVNIAAGVISIGQAVATTDSVTFNTGSFTGDVTVVGSLEVQGALTYLNTTNLEIEDNEIILNKGGTLGGGATAGFRFQDISTGARDLILQWDGSDSRFEMLDSAGAFQDLKIKNLAAETIDLSGGGAIVEAIQSIAASSGTTAMANGKTIIMVGKANQVTLPAVAAVSGVVIKIKNDDNACGAGADAIVIAAATGEQIELAASIRLESPSAAISVISDGSKWYVM